MTMTAKLLQYLRAHRVRVSVVMIISSSLKRNPLVPVKGPWGLVVDVQVARGDGNADEQHVDEYAGECEHPQPLEGNLERVLEGAEEEHEHTGDGHEYSHG